MRLTWLAAVLLCVTSLPAQYEEFTASYADAERRRQAGEDAGSVASAYAQAVRHYLQIADPEVRRAQRPAGAFSALQAGQHALAAELFAEIAAAGEQDAALFGWRLQALLGAGKDEDALLLGFEQRGEYPDAVLQALGRSSAALPAADRLLRRGRTEPALWLFRLQAQAYPEDPVALANLALALRNVGAEEDSEALYRTALALAPQDGLLWNDFGLFLLGTGRRDEAVAAFRRSVACEEDPAASAAIVNLASLGLGIPHGGRDLPPAESLALLLRGRPDAAGGWGRRLLLQRLLAGADPSPRPADNAAQAR